MAGESLWPAGLPTTANRYSAHARPARPPHRKSPAPAPASVAGAALREASTMTKLSVDPRRRQDPRVESTLPHRRPSAAQAAQHSRSTSFSCSSAADRYLCVRASIGSMDSSNSPTAGILRSRGTRERRDGDDGRHASRPVFDVDSNDSRLTASRYRGGSPPRLVRMIAWMSLSEFRRDRIADPPNPSTRTRSHLDRGQVRIAAIVASGVFSRMVTNQHRRTLSSRWRASRRSSRRGPCRPARIATRAATCFPD